MEYIVTVFVMVIRPITVYKISIIIEERAIVEDNPNPLKLYKVAGF
jgi:hypothetical protein